MKIVLLYTYNQGYLSHFFFELCTMLSNKGYEVSTFSLKRKAHKLKKDGIKINIKKRGGYVSTYFQIFNLLNKIKPDVVLSNFSYVNPSLLFGRLLGVKKNMVWFHSLNEQMAPTWSNIFIKRQFLRLADITIANSYLTADELKNIYYVPDFKIKTVAFWSTISEQNLEKKPSLFRKKPKSLNIGCPGRMATHKNQKVVVEALSMVNQDNDFNFHLYFAGDGQEKEALKSLCNHHELNPYVTFCGHLSSDEMIAFYKEMDVIILPSLHEAFGLVFIEAISLGTPVLVSSQFGALSFIDKAIFDLSKFTFNPESSHDLKNKLITFEKQAVDFEFFKKLYIETFDKTRIFNRILEHILL